jgi:hypothetical protein
MHRIMIEKTGSYLQNAHWLCPAGAFLRLERLFPAWNQSQVRDLSVRAGGFWAMRVERDVQVTSVEVVGEAYAIASNFLRKRGAIPDNFSTNERLLEIIVKLFQHGEFNKIRLANKAIAQFEAETLLDI